MGIAVLPLCFAFDIFLVTFIN